jgi:hypothetical protein
MLWKPSRAVCEYCGQVYHPRVPDQRYCRPHCRKEAMSLDAIAARRAWAAAGRPISDEAREVHKRTERRRWHE